MRRLIKELTAHRGDGVLSLRYAGISSGPPLKASLERDMKRKRLTKAQREAQQKAALLQRITDVYSPYFGIGREEYESKYIRHQPQGGEDA